MTGRDAELILHASCVAVDGRGLLILGPSGAGKSTLALQLMSLGASLVSDDRTVLLRQGAGLVARAPAALSGLIEARGLGLLHAPSVSEIAIHAAVDLAQVETERLPPPRKTEFLGVICDLVLGPNSDHFPAAMMCYLRNGRFA